MGRVTVFTDEDCGSRMLIKMLDENDVPFHEISLLDHPGRRADMITLTSSVTTPQVFFNSEYIGGYLKTKNLLERYKEESKLNRYSSLKHRITIELLDVPMQDVDNLRLPPTKASDDSIEKMKKEYEKWRQNLESYDELILLNGEKTSVTQVTRDFKAWFTSKFAKERIKKKMPGGEISSFIMKKYGFNDIQSITFAEKLVGLGVLHDMSGRTTGKRFAQKALYSLECDQASHTVNNFRIWSKNLNIADFTPDPTPFFTVSKLMKSLSIILESAMNCQGAIDYDRAQYTPGYKHFQEEVAYLQLINLRMDDCSKIALFINIYNIMIIHFSIEFSTKKMTSDMYRKFNYNVGGYILSLDDIYHGILRGNANHPLSGKKVFSEKDARLWLSLKSIDPRIHFALNNVGCCSSSYEFHSGCIKEELLVVTKKICTMDQRIVVDDTNSILILPPFFKTYLCDFVKASEASGLPHVLLNYLEGEKHERLKWIMRRGMSSKKKVEVQFRKTYESNTKNDKSGKRNNYLCGFFPWKFFLKKDPKNYVKKTKAIQNNSNDGMGLFTTGGGYQYSFIDESTSTINSNYKFSERIGSFMSSERSIISRVRKRVPSFDVFRVDTNILSDSGSESEAFNNVAKFPRTPTRTKVITKEESFSRTPMTSTTTPDSYDDIQFKQTGNISKIIDTNYVDSDEVSNPEVSKPPVSRRLDFDIELMDELFSPSIEETPSKDRELFPEDADYSQFEGSFTESDLVSKNGSVLGRSDYSRSENMNFTDDEVFIRKSLPVERRISVASF